MLSIILPSFLMMASNDGRALLSLLQQQQQPVATKIKITVQQPNNRNTIMLLHKGDKYHSTSYQSMGASSMKLKGCLTHLTVLFVKCKFLCLLGFYSNAIVNHRNDFLYEEFTVYRMGQLLGMENTQMHSVGQIGQSVAA